MSLADELEALLNSHQTGVVEVSDFVLTNKDAILTALRGRDAVLEEAALVAEEPVPVCCGRPVELGECCGMPEPEPVAPQVANAIRAMKKGK